MSQEKAQLIAPIDSSFTVPGVTVSGVITATSFDGTITGVADSITQGKNLNVGVVTALSFAGNLTGNAGGLTGSPNTVAGVVTANSFVGGITGNITGDVIGNATGVGASIKQGNNLNVGIATAWKWYGDGAGLTGLGGTSWAAQEVTASSAETIIDLTYGNLVYLTQSSNTTVGFASTAATQEISIVRATNSSNTITWPDRITWSGGSAPTLVNNPRVTAAQVFRFISVDSGLTYSGWEEIKSDSQALTMWRAGKDVALGDFGSNDKIDRSSPVQLPGNWSGMGNISSGGNALVATKTDGTLWAWGQNSVGQLGLNQAGNPTSVSSPTQVGTDTTWSKYLTLGPTASTATVAAKTDGTLWVWGNDNYGQLGLNQGPGSLGWGNGLSSPTQLPGTWDISSRNGLATGQTMSMAVKGTGALWAWGYNSYGNLGQNDKTNQSSPVQVGTDTTWSEAVFTLYTHGVLAVKTNGTLWSWGRNTDGTLGLNDEGISRSSPTQIGTGTDWSTAFSSGENLSTCGAIKTDGTLYMWGKNHRGQLGLNNTTKYSSPVQVPGTIWKAGTMSVSGGYGGVWVTKTDGTLWAWGANRYGSLGLNLGFGSYLSSPTQVGTSTDWDIVGSNAESNWGLRYG